MKVTAAVLRDAAGAYQVESVELADGGTTDHHRSICNRVEPSSQC